MCLYPEMYTCGYGSVVICAQEIGKSIASRTMWATAVCGSGEERDAKSSHCVWRSEAQTLFPGYDFDATPLGVGHYGVVYLCCSRETGQQCVCKVVDVGKANRTYGHLCSRQTAHDELRQLQLQHPNIVACYRYGKSEAALGILCEYAQCGDCMERVLRQGPLDHGVCSTLLFDVSAALRYLHQRQLAHRDAKLENILQFPKTEDASLFKLGDLGLLRASAPLAGCRTCLGTLIYMAPEVAASANGCPEYGFQADMWSLGICMFIALFGMPPYYDDVNRQQISQGLLEWPSTSSIVDRSFLSQLLVSDPRQRPRVEDVFGSTATLKWLGGSMQRPAL